MISGGEAQISIFNHFSCHCCHIRSSVVMMQNNYICQHSSVFTANGRFHILFKHNTIPCTIDYLSMILVVLEVGPIKVSKQCQYHFAGLRHIFICLGPEQ